MKKNIAGIICVFYAVFALVVPGQAAVAGANTKTTGGTIKYDHATHSKLQGEERIKAAEQIVKVENPENYPLNDSVFIAPGGSLKKIGLVIFDANIMRFGGKTPICCANLYPMQAVQQILSERMLEQWKTALDKHAVSDLTLVPLEKITQSAAYQKEGKAVKDYPNDKELSLFQKADKLLGFGVQKKASFLAVPGGSKVDDTDWAVPRGLRMFKFVAAPGGAAYQNGLGDPIKLIGEENGLDAAILVHTTMTWKTDYPQSISSNMKGIATMAVSASLNVPYGRWEEALKAIGQKNILWVKPNPAFRKYNVSFEEKVTVPYDQAAQNSIALCCRDGMETEAERDIFVPMLAEYQQVVDMIVERMVTDLRSTHQTPPK